MIDRITQRYEEYRDEAFDRIIVLIKNGTIKCGKYAHLVKIDEDKIMKGKEFFNDGKDN